MVKPAQDHVAERLEQLRTLSKDVDKAIYTSETLRDTNTLAVLLLLKSLHIFTTNYDEEEVQGFLVDGLAEVLSQRRLPVTQEYMAKQAAMHKWLP